MHERPASHKCRALPLRQFDELGTSLPESRFQIRALCSDQEAFHIRIDWPGRINRPSDSRSSCCCAIFFSFFWAHA